MKYLRIALLLIGFTTGSSIFGQTDLTVIESLPDSVCNTGSYNLTVEISNIGGNVVPAGNADISWTEVGSSTWYTDPVTTMINLGSITHTFSVPADLSTCGPNTFKVAISSTFDTNPTNDTIQFTIFSVCINGVVSLVGDTVCASQNEQLEVDFSFSHFNPAILDWITTTNGGATWNSLGTQSTVVTIPNPQPNQIAVAIFDGGGICPNDSVEIVLIPEPVVNFQTTGPFCDNRPWVQIISTQGNNANDNIIYSSNGNGYFLDSLNDTTYYYYDQSDYSNSGLEIYVQTIAPPQCVGYDTLQVPWSQAPTGVVTGNTTACEGDTISLFAQGGFQHVWYDDVTNTTTPIYTGNNYQFVATQDDTLAMFAISPNICADTVIAFITVHQTPQILTIPDTTLCPGDVIQLATTEVNGGGTGLDWSWNPPFGLSDPNVQSPMLVAQGNTSFIVRGVNPITGCDGFDTINVSVPAGVVFDYFPDTLICPGNTIILETNASAANVVWTPNTNISSTTDPNPAVYPNQTTNYIIEVNGTICSFSDTITVTVDNPQGYVMICDSVFCMGEEFTASMTGGSVGSYSWSVDGVTQSSTNTLNYQPLDVDSMVVQCDMISANGCSFLIERTVYQGNELECGGEINNAFSPNGDGVNDTWVINILDGSTSNSVQILTRYGDKLVSFENYDNVSVVWDGTNASGKAMPSGTYYYVIEVDGDTIAGWVNISR